MAKRTVAQLTADLEALRVHCDRVETERDSLRAELKQCAASLESEVLAHTADYNASCQVELDMQAEINSLRDEVAKLKAAPQRSVRPAYTPRPPSAEQLAIRAAMAAAKELAMRTGRSVRVGE